VEECGHAAGRVKGGAGPAHAVRGPAVAQERCSSATAGAAGLRKIARERWTGRGKSSVVSGAGEMNGDERRTQNAWFVHPILSVLL